MQNGRGRPTQVYRTAGGTQNETQNGRKIQNAGTQQQAADLQNERETGRPAATCRQAGRKRQDQAVKIQAAAGMAERQKRNARTAERHPGRYIVTANAQKRVNET